MTIRHVRKSATSSVLALGLGLMIFVSACSLDVNEPTRTDVTGVSSSLSVAGSGVAAVGRPDSIHPLVTPPAGLLSYFGGPIIGSVTPVVVNWNANVDARIQQNMVPFLNALGTSDMWSLIASEYGTQRNANAGSQNGQAGTQQTIGFGSATSYTLSQTTSTTLTDSTIRTALSAAITASTVPQPTANTLYMITLPPGSKETRGGQTSCAAGGFCAYHSNYNNNGVSVRYAVLLDTSVDCASGCGSDGDYLNNATSVASHELIEAVTDPLGQQQNYSDAWDGAQGEIGDLCNLNEGSLWETKPDGTHWVMQTMYDNVNGGCACGLSACCTPRTTCGNSCGVVPDNCGGTISCGCPSGQICENSVCTYPTSGPPTTCNLTQCREQCEECNNSGGICKGGNCVCSSKHACF
jgi:hypothetical protein